MIHAAAAAVFVFYVNKNVKKRNSFAAKSLQLVTRKLPNTPVTIESRSERGNNELGNKVSPENPFEIARTTMGERARCVRIIVCVHNKRILSRPWKQPHSHTLQPNGNKLEADNIRGTSRSRVHFPSGAGNSVFPTKCSIRCPSDKSIHVNRTFHHV